MANMNINDKRATPLSGNNPSANSKQDADSGPGLGTIKRTARSYKMSGITPNPTNIAGHKRGPQGVGK